MNNNNISADKLATEAANELWGLIQEHGGVIGTINFVKNRKVPRKMLGHKKDLLRLLRKYCYAKYSIKF